MRNIYQYLLWQLSRLRDGLQLHMQFIWINESNWDKLILSWWLGGYTPFSLQLCRYLDTAIIHQQGNICNLNLIPKHLPFRMIRIWLRDVSSSFLGTMFVVYFINCRFTRILIFLKYQFIDVLKFDDFWKPFKRFPLGNFIFSERILNLIIHFWIYLYNKMKFPKLKELSKKISNFIKMFQEMFLLLILI